jgi:ParB family transcriptional regulator, chromosome partitioning protein
MAESDAIVSLSVEELQPNPLQPRGIINPDSLVELADSLREHGLLEPLVVAKTPAGFQIIAGERRWRAAKLAGLTQLPVVVKETTPQGMLEMAIVENVQRVDLNPLERALAYRRLTDEFSMSAVEIAQRVGKSGPYIANTLRLLELPDALKDGLLSGITTEGHVRALQALDDPKLIVQAYKLILEQNLSVRGAEELARRMKAQEGMAPRRTIDYAHSPEIEEMERNLAQALGNIRAQLRRSQRGGKLTLTFKTDEELQSIYDKLTG